eukprot:g2782.t1
MRAFTATPKKVHFSRQVNKRRSPVRPVTVRKLSCSSYSISRSPHSQTRLTYRTTPSHSFTHTRLFATSAEETSNLRRWKESGGSHGSPDQWKWTLNWNEVDENILIGSCPRATIDIDTIADVTGANAILSVQSDLCLDALQIDYPKLRDHGLMRGVLMSRVPIRDFDHEDQSLMLPEAVKTLALLVALNYRVYVHCTAGINRASLTVLGYLTFVKGADLNSAMEQIKKARPQANPYIDCWKTVKTRLLEGRQAEVVNLSRKFFLNNKKDSAMDSLANWVAAEDLVIKETFRRLLSSTLNTISSITDLKADALCSVCVSAQEIDQANREIEDLKYELSMQRKRLDEAMDALEMQKLEHEQQTSAIDELNGFDEINMTNVYEELLKSKTEVGELKDSIKKIARVTTEALSMVSIDPFDDDEVVVDNEEDEEEEEIFEEENLLEEATEVMEIEDDVVQ